VQYSLRHNLSYCLIDGHAIFLDLDGDRYFQLDDHLEPAFLAHIDTGVVDKAGIDALIERRILVRGSAPDRCSHTVTAPTRSSLELTAGSARVGVTAILRVITIVRRTRRQLRTQPIRAVLDDLLRYREDRQVDAAAPEPPEVRILEHASVFGRSRLYVPLETSTSCLLDSIALTKYLADHGVWAHIVFGVTSNPFSAHCWVQYGDLVLNDTVGNAASYTPIRVI